MAKIPKSGNMQFPLDLRISNSNPANYRACLLDEATEDKGCKPNYIKGQVVVVSDVFEKKRKDELTKIYFSVVNRARHLFER